MCVANQMMKSIGNDNANSLLEAHITENNTIDCHSDTLVTLVICPIAIAYSMGQIIKSVCVCLSVCLSVCHHSHGRISLSIFTKFDTEV